MIIDFMDEALDELLDYTTDIIDDEIADIVLELSDQQAEEFVDMVNSLPPVEQTQVAKEVDPNELTPEEDAQLNVLYDAFETDMDGLTGRGEE
jgi:hypothetical protein